MSYLGSSAAPLPVAFAGVNSQSFNGGTNTFTLSRSVGKTTDVELVVNNVQQNPFDGSYSVSGTTLTTAEAVSAGVGNVYVYYLDAPLGSLSDPFGIKKSGDTLTGALNEAANVTLASAGTVAIGAAAANTINISGTTTITAFDTIAAGAIRRLVFAGSLTLTHNATSLILPGAASVATAAGDVAAFVSLGGGNWKCFTYTKANGQALVSAAGAFQGIGGQLFTSTGTFTVPAGVTALKVTVIGGGGAGGGVPANNYSGTGGGGGGLSVSYITGLTPGATITATVGAGGAGSTGAGGAGGTSSFGAYCSATGGGGGSSVNLVSGSAGVAGAVGGSGSGGTFNFTGASGAGGGIYAQDSCTYVRYAGTGGNFFYYTGAAAGMWLTFTCTPGAGYSTTGGATYNGGVASGYGGGGGGGVRLAGAGTQTGGAGSAGMIFVEY